LQLTGLLPVVRRWWLALFAAAVVAGCIGLGVASIIAPTYEAEVRLLVGPLNTDVNTLRASGQLARTYAELATSEPLLAATLSSLDDPGVGVDDVDVRATADEVTRVLAVRVRAKNEDAVAPIANGLAEQLEDRVDTGIVRPEGELQVVDAARPPDAPVAPRVPLTGVLSALAGLLVATTLVLVFEYLTPMARTSEHLERIRPGIPLIATLPRRTERQVTSRGPARDALGGGPTVATYALAGARLNAVVEDGRSPVFVVISAGPLGQASHVAVNLAAVFVAQGRKPILVEADRAGATSRILGIDPRRSGTTNHLARPDEPVELTHVDLAGAVGIDVLPYGTAGRTFATGAAVRQLLSALGRHGDPVIVEASAIARDPDSLAWATAADAVLLVVQRNRDRLDEVEAAIDGLLASDARLVGILADETVIASTERSIDPAREAS
jgi:capsular polysaccharide biosynthesis protein/Mrp family chromosome partitioning ATPase